MQLSSRIQQWSIGYLFLIIVTIYRGLLDQFYYSFSGPFEYYGMLWEPRSFATIASSYLVMLLIGWLLPKDPKRPSNILWVLMYLFTYVPVGTQYCYNANHSAEAFWALSLVFGFVSILMNIKWVPYKLEVPKATFSKYWVSVGLMSLGALAFLIVYFGVSLKVPSLTDVYDARSGYKEQSGRLSGYIFNWTGHFINTAFFVLALYRRNILLVVLAVAIELYLFTIGGHKSMLLMFALVGWVFIGARYMQRHLVLYLSGSLMGLMAVLFLVDTLNGEYTIFSSLLVRRNALLPAQLYFYFFDYFSSHPVDHFAQNFPFNMFWETNYDTKLPKLIGTEYFSFKDDIYANGNIFADIYANMGTWGFVVIPLILTFMFKVMDRLSANKNVVFTVPLFSAALLSLTNSGLIVNLITHGLLVAYLLVLLYPLKRLTLKGIEARDLS